MANSTREPIIHCKYDALLDAKDLKHHPKNRNKHDKDQLQRLTKIIEYQGWRYPVKVSNLSGYITTGHGRTLVAESANWKVPVVYQDYTDSDQEYSDVQADNAIASWAELDLSSINLDVPDLGPDFDIDMLGIKDFSIDAFDKYADKDADEVPEVKESTCKTGDLWILGNHRLLCGDATKKEDVELLIAGSSPSLMVTDPPYGVNLDQSWRDEALGKKALGRGNDLKVQNDDRADWTEVWALSGALIAYVWHASSFTDVVMKSLRNADYDVRQQIIWNKSVMVMGRSHYHFKHEPCWYAVKSGSTAEWKGDRKQTTVWDAAPPNHIMGGSTEDKTPHPTQKPSVLFEIPIKNHTEDGDFIYEPFCGSGTAIIAAEKLGRRCLGMEIDPHYCDVIIARWEKFTGKKAVKHE